MKRTGLNLQSLAKLLEQLVPYLLLLLGLPLLILIGFGFYAIYRLGYFWIFLGVLCFCTALGLSPFLWIKYKAKKQLAHPRQIQPEGQRLVKVALDWSDFDQNVWHDLSNTIDEQLTKDSSWGELRSYALQLVRQAAQHYHRSSKRSEWVFTLPEFLKMSEEVSRRYRLFIKQNVPLAETINLSMLKLLYEHRDKQQTFKEVWKVYRIIRLMTPSGLIAEARSQLLDHMFKDMKEEVQMTLKRAFLEEVASVAIDLYSGRFKVDQSELGNSQTWQSDMVKLAAPPEPLRVSLLGQVSAGKSSIVNALMGHTTAEVSQLPSTDRTMVYQLKLKETTALSLIDLPGLDGNHDTESHLLDELTQSDVVLWVLKANQPARSLDTGFKQQLDAWFNEPKNRSRKPPVIIGILSQVDRLPPVQAWNPPYALQQDDSAKATTIRDALQYNQALMGFEILIPLSLSPDKPPYNLEQLQQLLDQYYEQGLQTQLNRRRLEAANQFSVSEQFKRAYRMGQSLFKS